MITTSEAPIAVEGYSGRGMKRKEDPRFLTGAGRFTDDLAPPGTLHVGILRSPHAHARILAIDVSAARALPGVLAVYTGVELRDRFAPLPCGWLLPGLKLPPHHALAYDKVRHVGDGVALVVGANRHIASDALEVIRVEYEPLAAVVDQELATAPGSPQLHATVPNNIAFEWGFGEGEYARATERAEVTLRQRIRNQRVIPNALEARAVLAQYDRVTQELTVTTSTQVPHLIRLLLAETLELPEHRLRVISPDVGGAFGSKLYLYAEEQLCGFLARELGQPVKWSEGRGENYRATVHGRDHVQDVELAARRDGTMLGVKVTAYANLGGYVSQFAPAVPTGMFGPMLAGPYRISHLECKVYGVLTNTTPVDAYRGAGRPEATFLLERMIDLLARELGMDPVKLRRRNYIGADQFPYASPAGPVYDSGNYEVALDRVLEMAGYHALRRQQAKLREQGRYMGIGITSYLEISGKAPSWALGAGGGQIGGWESATVRVHPTGKVTVYTGSSPQGQGHETTYAQLVADELGAAPTDIDIVHGDTARVQFGNGTFGSRSAAVGGSAIKLGADKVIGKATKLAAHLMEVAEEDVEFKHGVFSVIGSPDTARTLADVSRAAHLAHNLPAGMKPGLEEQAFYDPSNFTWPFGTHLAVVEVDPETGQIDLHRYIAVDDCGAVINPKLVEGQIHGGIAQGLGQALLEGAMYDPAGQLLTGSLMEYAIPHASHLPALESDRTVTPTPVNQLGVKGVGEVGALAAPPCVVNAILDALHPFGVTHIDMPLTPEKVWRAIRAGEDRG